MSRTYIKKPRDDPNKDEGEEKLGVKRMDTQKLTSLKLEAATNILMAFRKSKIDNFIDKHINQNDDNDSSDYDFEDGLDREKRMYLEKSCCLFRSGGGFKVRWDLLIMVLAIWNCFMIPIQVAYDPPFMNTILFLMQNYIIDFLFFMDIVVNFRTSFIHSKTGEEIFTKKEIIKNYLKRRFWVDLLATIPFDTIGSLMFSSANTSLLQLFSLLKLARVLRLSRIIAYLNVGNEIKMSLKLFKLVFFLLLYLHCLGCAWYLIVDQERDWIPPLDYVYVTTTYFDQDINYKYWMGLYHAVLLLTGNDIGPRGWFQVAFAAFFITVGAVINANMFGELAVIVTTMNRKTALFHEKIDISNTAMKTLGLPEQLQKRVISFITYTQNLLEFQDELKKFLSIISPSLREEVLCFMFATTLNGNKLFRGKEGLIKFVTSKMDTKIHLPEDTIVIQGEEGDKLFFIARGECKVYVRDHKGRTEHVNTVVPGDLFGEVSLICNCKRTGTVKTRSYSVLSSISKLVFHDMIQQFDEVHNLLKKKMRQYQDTLKVFIKNFLKDIPYIKDQNEDILEEIYYHIKPEYYEKQQIVFRTGDIVDRIYFIVSGEVDLLLNLNNEEFVIDTLYQGCWVGAYKVLVNGTHSHTMRTVSNCVIHYITKDSLAILMNSYSHLSKEVSLMNDYVDTTEEPIVDFCLYRHDAQSITGKQIVKLTIVKLIKWNRKIKVSFVNSMFIFS